MKKTLLASLLALSFVGSANAATFNVANAFDISGVTSVSVGAFGGTDTYWDVDTVGVTEFTFTLTTPGPLNVHVFADTDESESTVTLGAPVFSGSLTFGNPLSFSLNPGSFAFKLSTPQGVQGGDLVTAVPVPAAAWLFGSALFGAGALRRKQKTA